MTYWTAMLTSKKSSSSSEFFKRIISFAPAVVWVFFVLYFSLMPGDDVPNLLAMMNDKLVHGLIYFCLSFLIYFGFIRYNFSIVVSTGTLWAILIACTIVGVLVEIIQHYWVINRNGDWQDFVANTLGSLLSVLLIRLIQGLRA